MNKRLPLLLFIMMAAIMVLMVESMSTARDIGAFRAKIAILEEKIEKLEAK